MSAYRTILVGTDGSVSSYRAVDKAAALASVDAARLVIACAYYPVDERDMAEAIDVLKDDAYQVLGSAPSEEILRTAFERARAQGAGLIEKQCVKGPPVETLLDLAHDTAADLIVVGNRGLNTLAGRILGSVSSDVARKARCDVLIVHTMRS